MDIGSAVRIKATGEEGVVMSEIDTTRQGASGANWWVKLPNYDGARALFTAEIEEI